MGLTTKKVIPLTSRTTTLHAGTWRFFPPRVGLLLRSKAIIPVSGCFTAISPGMPVADWLSRSWSVLAISRKHWVPKGSMQ